MPSDYEHIAEENLRKYGTAIDRYGPVLLTRLYSDRTHFVYELLQNAEDARAKEVQFRLSPDRLEVRHDGRPFDKDDVIGICGLVEGTGADDLTRIGKFGIGFKSVYAYTNTPKVFSGDEAFCIENYVQPYAVPKVEIEPDDTLFIFPFDHGDVPPEQARNAIAGRLRELGLRTLLFLRSISKISWAIAGAESGVYSREEPDMQREQHARRVHIISKFDDEKQEAKWVVFERPVEAGDGNTSTLRVEVAFRISRDSTNGKETIASVQDSPLVVFFPTEKETYLKFLVHGPFRTNPPRDNIPRDDEWNKTLVDEIAGLVSSTLPKIKAMGLLTPDFLNVLPIDKELFPEDGMFRPIYDAVREKLKSEEDLLPAQDGYTCASRAFLARGQWLMDLLSPDCLSSLVGRHDSQWLPSSITDDRTPQLRKYLLEELAVWEMDPERFAGYFTEEFIQARSDSWVIQFYRHLRGQRALWRERYFRWETRGPLRTRPFIRMEGDAHVAPFHGDRPLAYLPTEDRDSSFPTIKRTIAADPEAAQFLREDLGLTEPDVVDEIIEHILPKYDADPTEVSPEENLHDVGSILHAVEEVGHRREEVKKKATNTAFLWSVNPSAGTEDWSKPQSLYLGKPYTDDDVYADLETYFEGNQNVYFVDERYRGIASAKSLLEFGCSDTVRVRYSTPSPSGHVPIKCDWGDHERGLDRFDPNCEIEGLEKALATIDEPKAQIIWRILLQYHQSVYGTVESCPRQNYVDSHKERRASAMGKLVRGAEWLPDRYDCFHVPGDLLLSDLPEGFDTEGESAKSLSAKLGMKHNIEQEYLAMASDEERERIELAKKVPLSRLRELVEQEERAQSEIEVMEREAGGQASYAEELVSVFARPATGDGGDYRPPAEPIPDTGHRRTRVQEEIDRDMANEPPLAERVRPMVVMRWEGKNKEIRTFLNEEYNGECQVCGDGFLKRDNTQYFEGLYLVPRTKRAWYNRRGNVLCLCANCCAKFQHGEVDALDIVRQILDASICEENGPTQSVIPFSLCGEEVTLAFSQRHILDLQEMLKAEG